MNGIASCPPPAGEQYTIRNRTFDEIAVGDEVTLERTLTEADIQLFAMLSGDVNPQHLDSAFASSTRFGGVIAHGMWGAALISAALGTRLPGPGTVYLSQTLKFRAPVRIGDTLKTRVKVSARDEQKKRLTLDCACVNQDGATVIEGQAQVLAPTERVERPRATLPEVRLIDRADKTLFDFVRPLGPIRIAVVHPCDTPSLAAMLAARQAGLIEPLIIAPRAKVEAIASAAGLDIGGIQIEDVRHSHAAAGRAVHLAASGQVEALIKGSLFMDELMSAIVAHDSPLRTERRVSHCYLIHTPAYPRPFIITDAAINIAPTLEEKADIVRNAIELAQIIGVVAPRVAILAAVETINPRMPATLDAAALCKMADRGQISGGTLDGPLALDNAISAAAAHIKGIQSPVAGQADVLVVPDMESGNLLAKHLEFLGDASNAGVVMGARVPVILPGRADSQETRIASYALAALVAHRRRQARAV